MMNVPRKLTLKAKKPPLYGLIKLLFPYYDFDKNDIITVGNTIYTRSMPSSIALWHERVHAHQQKYSKLYFFTFYLWKYAFNSRFRLQMEAEAFRSQYAYAKKVIKDRNKLSKYLLFMVTTLADPRYKLDINEKIAREIITK
ncbi:MAG: hypothetical protein AABY22_17165, partial [Nanoarchaeota archaeon]